MSFKGKKKIISGILLCTMCMYTMPVCAFTKEETVYAKMNQEGKNYSTIVSTHLENEEGLEIIQDMTDLLNIENTRGEEQFEQEGNSLVWKANKKDIYYQGESQKDLPIVCNVTYELDGKELEAQEIAGKTGKVTITIHYENKEEHWITINGKEEKMYTPFVVVAGTVIQNDKNENIEISNGKLVNDGSKTWALGIAMLGLQESLKLDTTELEIPNDIVISMEATNFELGNIITFATPKVFEEEDLKIFNKLDEMYSQVDTLETTTNQIEKGSAALAEGSNQLASGSKKLTEGSNSAYRGAKQIKEEVAKATNQLANDKKDTLDSTILSQIGEQAKQAAVLTEAQKTAIGSQAQAQAEQVIQGQKTEIGKKAESQVAALTLTEQQKQQIKASVKTGLEANADYQKLPQSQQEMILQFSINSSITAAEATARETAKQVANRTAQSVATEVAGNVANTTAQTVAGEVAIQSAQTTAIETAKQVANQVKEQAQSQVVTQMNTLGEGLNQLTNGLGELKNGTNSLQEGASNLKEGANTLATGVKTFNEEGIKKICKYINGDLKEIDQRVEKLVELSKDYNHFTLLNGETKGEVKFIMIMDAIKEEQEKANKKEMDILHNEKKEYEKESTK